MQEQTKQNKQVFCNIIQKMGGLWGGQIRR